jgi:hypothetical protein
MPPGMSGHAAVELLSVLTRLPPPHRLSPTAACDRRAEPTYRVLGVTYELLSPISR